MNTLNAAQRRLLESAVTEARELSEKGAVKALQNLAADQPEPFAHMSPDQRELRRRLRAKARLLGDNNTNGNQEIENLSYELAYEYWHKMLFARFLEANNLLMHPTHGIAVSLDECAEFASGEGYGDKWTAAAAYASHMLPAIFRPEDPLMQVDFATEDRIALERLLEGIGNDIYTATDSLGWVYQFWQSKAKADINASGDKIDGKRLPAVTQLFTEPYMVHFLIDNTLGAWWVSRNPGVKPPVRFEYLRVAPTSSRSNIQNQDYGSSFFNPFEGVEYLKGNLPHWRQEGKMYFVTFRTADSMPQEKLGEWQRELDEWNKLNPPPHTDEQKKEYYKRFPAKIEEYLDSGYGACHLQHDNIKRIVTDAIKYFEGERYKLDEFVVAPNHVHVLVQPLGNHQLSDILHSWKSFTANQINKALDLNGTFWQKEYFDHLVRSEESLNKFRKYIKSHVAHVAPASSRSINEAKEVNALHQDGGATLHQDGGATFNWPAKTALITTLDPCMGSGHFVVELFLKLAPLRMFEEGLSKEEATRRVIADNLHGLEIDPRCTQIAAFNLALAAWKFCGHYLQLPEMNLACSGIAPKGKVEDWVKLVGKVERFEDKERMENGIRALYDHFQLAPELGSLLDPATIKADLQTASFDQLYPVLLKALAGEEDNDLIERGVMAAGIAKAGTLLAKKYTLQITNVPYLGRGKQAENGVIASFCAKNYPNAKGDLANVFFEKMLKSVSGTACSVMPQNWLFLTTYKKHREDLLKNRTWNFVARLGPGAFSQISGEVVKAILIAINSAKPKTESHFAGLDVSDKPNAAEKDEALITAEPKAVKQMEQLGNPDAIISFEDIDKTNLLGRYANAFAGIDTGDGNRFKFKFYELPIITAEWIPQLNSFDKIAEFIGREHILYWQDGKGDLLKVPGASIRNIRYWGKYGIYVVRMARTPSTLSLGEAWDRNGAMIIPKNKEHILPIWVYTQSKEFRDNVRSLNQKLSVSEATFPRIHFDLNYWQKVAAEKYPNGLPKPYSDDPTQWLFHGHPKHADNPLQVALARLMGYRWPAEKVKTASSGSQTESATSASSGSQKEIKTANSSGQKPSATLNNDIYSELSETAKTLIAQIKAFDHLADDDGLVCIPPVNGEPPATDRLRNYLREVWGNGWQHNTTAQLLQKEAAINTDLEQWLREEFFAQHCKVFNNRPFIWHIWDGRKDGFAALVNYHKLTRANLQKLIYTYLNDWIRQCERKQKDNESGADGLLMAARQLKTKLELILEGEPPYDIFVRWKPLHEQPIGWEPDLNDGVRLNIYPFMQAGILRKNPTSIKWQKDRGKNPAGSPWGPDRYNRYEDLDNEYKLKDENGRVIERLSNEVKRKAREGISTANL